MERRPLQVLKQGKHDVYSLAEEVAILWAASKGHLDALETDKIVDFEKDFMDVIRTKGKDWMKRINKNKIMDEKDEKELEKLVKSTL